MRKTEVMTKLKANQKGITLIALVITIIVLLILAGVAISMLSGENGILTQAQQAKSKTEKTSTLEQVRLAAVSALTVGEGKIEGEKALEELNKGLKEAGYKGTVAEFPATIEIDGTEYTIEKSGKVTIPTGDSIPVVTDVSKLTTPVAEKTIYEDNTAKEIDEIRFTNKSRYKN